MANGNFAGGAGSRSNPYLIEDAHDLNAVRNDKYAYYKLINDIDLDVAPYNEGEGWNPLPNLYKSRTFDGDFYKIKNLYQNRSGSCGLFDRIYDTEIINLGLVNVNINSSEGSPSVGALASYAGGSCNIKNCFVEGGQIVGGQNIGGLIGETTTLSYVYNCYTKCYLKSNEYTDYIGGICGFGHGLKIYNSHSSVTINTDNNSNTRSGGLVGRVSANFTNRSTIYYNLSNAKLPETNNTDPLIYGAESYTNISYNFFNTETTGKTNSSYSDPLTEEEMKNPENFSNYNSDIWILEEGEFPRLWFEKAPIKTSFLFQDDGFTKSFDLTNKKWITVNSNSRDTKSKGIKSLDNLIQNTTKTKKTTSSTTLSTGKQFNQPVNLKSFKTINNIEVV